MATKSIIDIELNDQAFQKFIGQYKAYESALANSPAAWKAVSQEIDGSRAAFDKLVGAASARLASARLNAEAEKVAAAHLHRATGETATQARSWSSMAKDTKAFASHIGSATVSLLRWSGVVTAVGGLLGAGGLFGIDRLAQSVAGQRKDASGLRVTPGELKSFGLNFGRILDNPMGFLTGVSESLSDVTKAAPYGALGLNYNQERQKNPADVAIDVLRAEKRLADRTPQAQLGNVFSSRQIGMLGQSVEDFQRIKDRPLAELEDYIKNNRKDRNDLNLNPDQLRGWENFKVQLDRAGSHIEKTFVVALTPLAPKLDHLSDEFTKVVDAFLRNPDTAKWIDEVADGLDHFANYIGTPEFKSDVEGFVHGVGEMAGKIVSGLRLLGLIPDAAVPGGNDDQSGSLSKTPVGSPAWNNVPDSEQSNYVNSPRSQAFLNPNGDTDRPFNLHDPSTWLHHKPGTEPARPSPFPGGSSFQPAAFRPGGASPVVTGDRVKEAHDFFRAAGWDESQTAGLLANIGAESGFKPGVVNGSGHQGLAQWDRTRSAQFRRMFGHDPAQGSFEEQLVFMQWELQNTEKKAGDRLRGSRSAGDAAAAINEGYERSGTNSGARSRAAGQYMQQFRDRSVQVQIHNATGGNAHVTVSQLAV